MVVIVTNYSHQCKQNSSVPLPGTQDVVDKILEVPSSLPSPLLSAFQTSKLLTELCFLGTNIQVDVCAGSSADGVNLLNHSLCGAVF